MIFYGHYTEIILTQRVKSIVYPEPASACPFIKAVGLLFAIRDYLYPWVADILQSELNVTDSIFHPENPDEYPSPQDPELCFLLTIAGVGSFCGIDFSLEAERMPTADLTNHRYAVLKLLYTLLLSDQFGEEEAPVEHQRAALKLFLSILESTFPLPPFITQDWCTPDLASKFVQITFEDRMWAIEDVLDDYPAFLVDHLFRFSPTMSETLEYAAAERLFDGLGKLDCYLDSIYDPFEYLSHTIHLFVTGLSSSNLNPHISQKFLAYLFEPDTLFAICLPLVGSSRGETLRGLVCLRPNDPAWPICLARLPEYTYPPRLSDLYDIFGILADLKTFLFFWWNGVPPVGGTRRERGRHGRSSSAPQNLS
ncbi:hypothetical protein DFS33DRAFT_1488633 [Desarmillaria ectypa]|nr:hypothetical protein DFS33DRAFT_1488633 [Desarmillaria ectypa]